MYVCVDTHTLLEADNFGSHMDLFHGSVFEIKQLKL